MYAVLFLTQLFNDLLWLVPVFRLFNKQGRVKLLPELLTPEQTPLGLARPRRCISVLRSIHSITPSLVLFYPQAQA